jgi:pyruvate dehydrogenase E2 component (dihydrolipoamide acetyltransferase)
MPTEVIMPALGMAQETGKVLRWLKAEGDQVAKDEPLLEIETDKVTVEIESPADGTLAAISAAEGDEVPVGNAIAFVLAAGEEVPVASTPAATPSPAEPERPRRALASPKARRLAAEQGIDLDALAASKDGGTIVAADLAGSAPVLGSAWRVMAERTTSSWQSAPHFYLRRSVDASGLERRREEARAAGASVTHTDLLIHACAAALRAHPRVNSSWRNGTIVAGESINVAIAVATDDALYVPVIRNADQLELAALAERRRELVSATREGRLRPEDVAGGTFTVSNLGMYAVDSFDAILNAPQAAILAVGRITDRVVPVNGEPAVRPMLELSLAFDHRVVDGARGAKFVDTLADLLER